jgi:outer membrane protease
MKRQACMFFLALLIVYPLHAQHAVYLPKPAERGSQDWLSLSLSVDSGLMFGMLYEYVFIDNENDGKYNDMLSKLDWQLNPLVYTGVIIQAEMWKKWILGVGFWIGIPGPLGRMEDRDWGTQALGYTGNLEVYSHHDNFLKEAVFADINFGYNVSGDDSLVFSPLIGFNYKHIFMSGRNGEREIPTYYSWEGLEVITYQQNYYIFYVGAQISWTPMSLLTLQLFTCYSPVVFSFNIDEHVGSATYIDLPIWGQYIHVDAAVFFHILNEINIRLKGSFSYMPVFKGQLYAKPLGSDTYVLYISDRGGGSFILGGADMSFIFNLE